MLASVKLKCTAMVVFVSSTALAQQAEQHKKLRWDRPGACVVVGVKTPCRTIRYHQVAYGKEFGFDAPTQVSGVDAYRSDGSESQLTQLSAPSDQPPAAKEQRVSEILLRKTGERVFLDHVRRIYEVRKAPGRGLPYWEEDDEQCSHTASHALYLSKRLPEVAIAGVQSVGYAGTDKNGAEYEVYFAPSIGCQDMRFHMTKRDELGHKMAELDKIVDSYELAVPKEDLFQIPSGYKRVATIFDSK